MFESLICRKNVLGAFVVIIFFVYRSLSIYFAAKAQEQALHDDAAKSKAAEIWQVLQGKASGIEKCADQARQEVQVMVFALSESIIALPLPQL